MYSKHQQSQYDECLVCQTPLVKKISLVQLIHPLPVCIDCLEQFEIIDYHIDFHHYPLHILYRYNEFFKTLLFQYKGLYDQALKDAFLCIFQSKMIQKYHEHIVVVAPSTSLENQMRGFAPMEMIASTFSSHIFTGLYKKEKYKQSQMTYDKRQQAVNKIGIHHGEMLRNQKVLILDDVITSSATLNTCLSLVLAYNPKSVELLVLSTKKLKEELRFEEGG
jgi:competence protein ComFC